MALYRVMLRSPELEATILGGRTRVGLARQSLQVFVDKVLTEEKRAQRRAMTPAARRLRAEGKRVRWLGAKLQVLVRQPGGRGNRWELVQFPPPPPAGGAGSEGRAAAEVGAGAGDQL